MIAPTDMEKIDTWCRTLNIIWGVMLLTLFIYLLVGIFVMGNIRVTMEESVIGTLRMALYALAFGILAITKVIRNLVLSGKGQGTSRVQTGLSVQYPAIGRYTAAMMVSLALSESIGLFGFVLFFLGKNLMDLYLLIAVAAASMLYYRPNKDELVELVKTAPDRTTGP